MDVWRDKYRYQDEASPNESMSRVCEGVYAKDTDEHRWLAEEAMHKGLWVPGGRIHAGAGTKKTVTMINCYVDRTIEDSMNGIADALKDAMLTMQQGGGIGMDFSTLRPSGAYLQRTGAVASGPLPFMDMWNAMCDTIMSAGSRRGAMMGVMACDHPDLLEFITAKQKAGRLTNFNVSVLITDAFMDAVENDEEWYLGFHVPRADGKHIAAIDRDDVPGGQWYVYQTMKARELWDKIIRNTYEYSEPGVIFIDRINDQNNLGYAETIACTNPCGEQPLPPNGACNLGAVNLARMVKRPFSHDAEFDFALLDKVVAIGVRFRDNVIDTTGYPLEAQRKEEETKRRIGLGITGLANALAMLGIRYGSEESLQVTNRIMNRIKQQAYYASALLAKERGPFPLYDKHQWGVGSPVVESLDSTVVEAIDEYGIRNGVLLTIAPTGTTSLYMGNCSSGLEPVFLHKVHRKVRQPDGTYREYEVLDYAYQLYEHLKPDSGRWDAFVDHTQLTVSDHVRMQATCQKHIDASVSKTINCPKDMNFESFKLVYWEAYNLGCKGCTTYRPSEIRGSVLSDGNAAKATESGKVQLVVLPDRPRALRGTTYKTKWPAEDSSYYITINDHDGKPYEMFISCTNSKYSDWTTALSLMLSALMRRGDDISFIPDELDKVVSAHNAAFVNQRFYGSPVGLIADAIREHLDGGRAETKPALQIPDAPIANQQRGEFCPQCRQPTLYRAEGCKKCSNCSFSTCG